MTKIEALDTLNLTDSATATEIDATYKAAYSEFQVQITNASTKKLRTSLEENLEKLETAYNTLTSKEGATALASTTPYTPAANTDTSTNTPTLEQGTNDESEKIKKKFKYLYIGLVVLAMVLATMVVMYVNIKTEHEKLAPLKARSEGLEKIKNKTFKLVNKGKKSFMLYAVKTFYFDEKYEIKSYEKQNLELTLNNEQSYTPEEVVGDKRTYDGRAVFYSIVVIDAESTEACPRFQTFSGIVEEREVVLNFDK